MNKFEDKGETINHFYDYRVVGCPKCAKPIDFFDLKLTCIHCGYHKEFKPSDMWYNLFPLSAELEDFLEIPCCGRT